MENERMTFDFHMAEYASLSSEIDWIRQPLDRLLLYISIANAAISSWISTFLFDGQDQNNAVFFIVSWIPVLILALTLPVYLKRRNDVLSLIEYLTILESKYAFEELGWSKYNNKRKRYLRSYQLFYVVYFLQLAFYIGFGVYVTYLAFHGNI